MRNFTKNKKVLFGLAVSLVLAMAVGSFALSEAQTPVTTQAQTTSNALTNNATCDFDVSGTASEYSYSDADGVLTITSGTHTISMKDGVTLPTNQRIVITGAAEITLNNVNIEAAYGAAIQIEDNATFNVSILLADGSTNILRGKAGDEETGEFGAPGIEKSNDTDLDAKDLGTLTIGVQKDSKGKPGKLEAIGGICASGIGSHMIYDATLDEFVIKNTSNIKITGGVITATGGIMATGIGSSGDGSNASNIEIEDGVVTATGRAGGAGIGSGIGGTASEITINGGEVTATAIDGGGAAGIGGGSNGNGNKITINGGIVKATGGVGGGAGIGGGIGGDGNDITISGGTIIATPGYCAAGIGGGATMEGEGGEANRNRITGNAVVLAVSGGGEAGKEKPALQGFDAESGGSITGGITFTGLGIYEETEEGFILTDITWDQIGEIHSNTVTISQSVELPADLTIGEDQEVTVGSKATLTVANGVKLTVADKGTLKNDGNIEIPDESLICNGKIETLLICDTQGGTVSNDSYYKTYKDGSEVKKYENLPEVIKDGYTFDGWFTEKEGKGKEVLSTDIVSLNLHTIYAKWIGGPTPTPPGPEPQPTPEPTPDPSVDPDGGGSGASSKTSDPFMGGAALLLLGIATTGAILTRKLK